MCTLYVCSAECRSWSILPNCKKMETNKNKWGENIIWCPRFVISKHVFCMLINAGIDRCITNFFLYFNICLINLLASSDVMVRVWKNIHNIVPCCYMYTSLRHAMHRGLGDQLTLMKNLKWGRRHYNFVPEMPNFLLMTSCRLMIIFVCRRLGGLGGGLGWILDIKGGSKRNHMIPFSEV